MNHPDDKKWMGYLYGELDRQKEAQLKNHLDSCDLCKTKVSAFRKVMTELDTWKLPLEHKSGRKKPMIRSVGRWAVAAVLMIAAGFIVGKLSVSQPIDQEQLLARLEKSMKSSLEPILYDRLMTELQVDRREDMVNSFVLLKGQLSEQFHRDLDDYAVQTLAASGMATNQLLAELIEAIDTAQTQDRRWFAAAISQVEYNRLRDGAAFANNLHTLASNTSDELSRTRKDVEKLLVINRSEELTTTPQNERNEK